MTEATGDCGEASLAMFMELHERGVPAHLCHGYPLGTGGNAHGIRYWHAWVELDSMPPLVIDAASGKRLAVPKDLYYEAGSIEPEHVRRYEAIEVAELVLLHGHSGPWIPEDEEPYAEWREV